MSWKDKWIVVIMRGICFQAVRTGLLYKSKERHNLFMERYVLEFLDATKIVSERDFSKINSRKSKEFYTRNW